MSAQTKAPPLLSMNDPRLARAKSRTASLRKPLVIGGIVLVVALLGLLIWALRAKGATSGRTTRAGARTTPAMAPPPKPPERRAPPPEGEPEATGPKHYSLLEAADRWDERQAAIKPRAQPPLDDPEELAAQDEQRRIIESPLEEQEPKARKRWVTKKGVRNVREKGEAPALTRRDAIGADEAPDLSAPRLDLERALGGHAEGEPDQHEQWAKHSRKIPTTGGMRARAACQLDPGTQAEIQLDRVINTQVGAQLFTLHFTFKSPVPCSGRQDLLAFPQGANGVASVNARIGAGQRAIQVCAESVFVREPTEQFPNGWESDLGCAPLAALDGSIGIPAEIDTHIPEQIAAAVLTTLTSFGARLAGGGGAFYGAMGYNENLGQMGAMGAAQAAQQIGNGYAAQLRAIPRTGKFVPTGKPVTIVFTSRVVVQGVEP